MTLKDLSILKWQHDCTRTTMPPDYVPKDKFTDKTANGLTKAIVTFLNLSGHQGERISTTGRMLDNTKVVKDALGFSRKIGSVNWIKGTGTNGSADISATIKGKSVKIEVKIGKDRQSEAQKVYQQNIERAGGIYMIAKTWDGFYEQYAQLTTNF
jgi:hypothetical protein